MNFISDVGAIFVALGVAMILGEQLINWAIGRG
jgi:hypothetical protein